jgi:hypothetical protein
VEVHWLKGRTIGHYFFRSQDLPALMMGCGALLLGGLAIRLAPEGRWSWGNRPAYRPPGHCRLRADGVERAILAVRQLQPLAR